MTLKKNLKQNGKGSSKVFFGTALSFSDERYGVKAPASIDYFRARERWAAK
ncbi:hypothetical protein J2TS6_45400 [Paenibacillus albilobatus]|uniref:Uncharacterized protein n=1 Tax=Paenibacillus albilobatus TaxID=2716884 RepID=A0A920CE02_9BACL|nr:hypothetical protein J2TS6_45400 [Paenibacillus albilobatus]